MSIEASSVQAPIRQFRVGSTNLADPDPAMSPGDVLALYSASYPALKFCTMVDPRMEGDILVIEATLPTVQTKGVGRSPCR